MIPVETARARVLDGLAPLAAELVPLPQAVDRVLAEDQAARVDHPPADVSAMDGYALRFADCGAPLAVIGQSAAGHPYAGTVGPGQAVRIFTGAPIPAGADLVVMQEEAERDGQSLRVTAPQQAGRWIRPRGMDFATGQVLLSAGTVMGPRQIALAAAMNLPWLPVRRRPRVAVLSTGDEVVMPGDNPGPAQLVSSNGPGLAAFVARMGGDPLQLGIARDSRESLAAMVAAASGCDLLVVSGGASVGDYDLVQDALVEAGMELDFWKIAMRPGKPLMHGRLRHVPVLGLPGNPVAAMVCAYLFLGPMLRRLQGLPDPAQTITAVLGTALPANDQRQDYLRAGLAAGADGAMVATPLGRQDSAVVTGLAAADCLIIRPPHAPAAEAGCAVEVMPLPF